MTCLFHLRVHPQPTTKNEQLLLLPQMDEMDTDGSRRYLHIVLVLSEAKSNGARSRFFVSRKVAKPQRRLD